MHPGPNKAPIKNMINRISSDRGEDSRYQAFAQYWVGNTKEEDGRKDFL